MSGLGDIRRINGDSFPFSSKVFIDDITVKCEPIEFFILEKGFGMPAQKSFYIYRIVGKKLLKY